MLGGWGWTRQRAVLLSGVGWLVASSSATNAILVRPPRSSDASVSSLGWLLLCAGCALGPNGPVESACCGE
jgi:hypothetical protein